MPRNGSGTYALPAGNPVVTNTTISSTTHNSTMSDIASALTTSICSDGQTPMAANLSMGTYKLTNLGAATISSDAVRYDQTLLLSGANTMAANLPMGSFRITGLALGTATTDAARVDQAVSIPGSIKLRGNPNGTSPLTKYDLSASYVVLKDSSNRCIAFSSTGTKTCDFGAAGSAINSRDQAAAFGANQWLYVYWISDGTSINTLVSLSATSPTLPGSYTYFCLATALYWNGSSNIVAANTVGSKVKYSQEQGLLSGGSATAETSVTVTTFVPPLASEFNVHVYGIINSSAGGAANVTSTIRTVSGTTLITFTAYTNAASQTGRNDFILSLDNTNNSLYYLISSAGSVSSAGLNIYGLDYTIPNGST